MTIIIKEIQVKTTVEKKEEAVSKVTAEQWEALKQEIREMFEEWAWKQGEDKER